MILQQVHLVVLDGQEAPFEAALCEVRQRVFSSPGFRGFRVLQDAEQLSRYLVQVDWETREELLAVAESGRLERCWTPVQAHLARPMTAEHFVERPALGLNGPGVVTDLSWTTD